MGKYWVKRTNITADRDIMFIGKRGICGRNAEPFDSFKSAQAALKRQKHQDFEYCPDCTISYEITSEIG